MSIGNFWVILRAKRAGAQSLLRALTCQTSEMCHEKIFASCCFCVNLKNACTIIALIHILTSFLLLASDENSFQGSNLKRLREFGCIACIGLGTLFLYEVIIEKREAILVYGYFYMLVVLLTCFELFVMAADGVEGF